MALSASAVWEVRTTGSDSNGGAFVTGASGTDRSQQDAAQATLSAASVVHTTTTQINVAVGDFTVSAADVGNLLQVTGGTATAGFYQITVADAANNRWTVDRAVGTAGQTVVGAMGGALASGGKAAGACVSSNIIFVKNGTYTISTSVTDVAGGLWLVGNFTKQVIFCGYGTTRTLTNTDTKPLIQYGVGVTSATWANCTAAFVNLAIDGTSQTGAKLVANGTFWRCSYTGFVAASTGGTHIQCSATANTAAIFFSTSVACEASANTATPFAGNGTHVDCLSYGNTGASTDGFGGGSALHINCTAYNNGRNGFSANIAVNCHAEANAGVGFSTNARNFLLVNCSGYNNTGGLVTGASITTQGGTVTVTDGSVFTNAAGADFSLNATALRGALLRAAGIPGAFPVAATTGHLDIGAAQHADPAGGSGGVSRARVTNMGGV